MPHPQMITTLEFRSDLMRQPLPNYSGSIHCFDWAVRTRSRITKTPAERLDYSCNRANKAHE